MYWMMPEYKTLFRVSVKNQEKAAETLRLCKAIAKANSQERIQAIGEIAADNQLSDEMRQRLAIYVVEAIREARSTIDIAHKLLLTMHPEAKTTFFADGISSDIDRHKPIEK